MKKTGEHQNGNDKRNIGSGSDGAKQEAGGAKPIGHVAEREPVGAGIEPSDGKQTEGGGGAEAQEDAGNKDADDRQEDAQVQRTQGSATGLSLRYRYDVETRLHTVFLALGNWGVDLGRGFTMDDAQKAALRKLSDTVPYPIAPGRLMR